MAGADVIQWWGWVLLWVVLVLGAAVVLGFLVYRLVRGALAVVRAAGDAGARVGELTAPGVPPPRPVPTTAVLDDPARLRRARARSVLAQGQEVSSAQGAVPSARGAGPSAARVASNT